MLHQIIAHYVDSAQRANAQGDYVAAGNWCRQALAMVPTLPEAWYHLGVALRHQGQRAQALEAFEKARAQTQDSADAQSTLGMQCIELSAYAQAEQCLQRALALAPDYALAHHNLGLLRFKQGRHEEAQAAAQQAISLRPDLTAAFINLSGILNAQNKYPEAESVCRQALALDPQMPMAWNNLGAALSGQWRYREAEAAYRRATELAPNFSEAWINLGNALNELKRFAEAATSYDKSLALTPQAEFVSGWALHAKVKLCDWRTLDRDRAQLLTSIQAHQPVASPFDVLSLTDDPAIQRQAAEIWVRGRCPLLETLGPLPAHTRQEKIRIGYFSADFHNHATTHLMAGLFEAHDRTQFELFAFSFGPDRQDDMRHRVAAAFDQFLDVRNASDAQICRQARSLGIDIAVDLKGYTQDSRPGIFAMRAAPIQVNYLGYPGTMGAAYMDYLIGDPTLIPTASQRHYSEKVVYLPHSYQVNDNQRRIADSTLTRADFGLPATGMVFCSFNNHYKILPDTFERWMRILRQVEGSVLWLLAEDPLVIQHLRHEAEQRGIAPNRLVFAQRIAPEDHLARHRLADLFLDTWPCNAHTTASDALWSGLPLVTYAGASFASRVAASLLHTIGLPELVTTSPDAYEALAVALAQSPARLAELKEKLAANRLTSPLFNTPLYTQHLEQAYRAMHDRGQRGETPDHLHLA